MPKGLLDTKTPEVKSSRCRPTELYNEFQFLRNREALFLAIELLILRCNSKVLLVSCVPCLLFKHRIRFGLNERYPMMYKK